MFARAHRLNSIVETDCFSFNFFSKFSSISQNTVCLETLCRATNKGSLFFFCLTKSKETKKILFVMDIEFYPGDGDGGGLFQLMEKALVLRGKGLR